MSINYNALAIPKGKTRKQVRAKAKRADTKALREWRDRAWRAQPGGDDIYQWGICAACSCMVYRTCYQPVGHVHHKVSRRQKPTRTDDQNAVILCRKCHNQAHGREF